MTSSKLTINHNIYWMKQWSHIQLMFGRICRKDISGIDWGEEAHQLFETFLGKSGIRLVQHLKYRETNSNGISDDHKKVKLVFMRISDLTFWSIITNTWKYISINGVSFLQLMNCDRRPATEVNPKTGKSGQQTLKVLRKYESSHKYL